MALPKKKSRLITVKNIDYRYIVSLSKLDENYNYHLNLIVQNSSGEGCKLKTQGLVARDYWLDFPKIKEPQEVIYPTLFPKHIAKIIGLALEKGWNPMDKANEFVLPIDISVLKS